MLNKEHSYDQTKRMNKVSAFDHDKTRFKSMHDLYAANEKEKFDFWHENCGCTNNMESAGDRLHTHTHTLIYMCDTIKSWFKLDFLHNISDFSFSLFTRSCRTVCKTRKRKKKTKEKLCDISGKSRSVTRKLTIIPKTLWFHFQF